MFIKLRCEYVLNNLVYWGAVFFFAWGHYFVNITIVVVVVVVESESERAFIAKYACAYNDLVLVS